MPHAVPEELSVRIETMTNKHVPKPRMNLFYEHLLTLAMDSIEDGKRPEIKEYIGRESRKKPTMVKIHHWIRPSIVLRFEKTCAGHFPLSSKREIHEYLLNLGIEVYKTEYDEFGINKK